MWFLRLNALAALLSFAGLLGNNFVASFSDKFLHEIHAATDEGLIQATDEIFYELVKTPRKHAVLAQFTVLKSFDCSACHILNGMLKTVSGAWQKTPEKDKLYFVTLDYSKAPNVFKKYQVTSAPNLYLFPASEKTSNNPAYVELKQIGRQTQPEDIIRTLEATLDIKIPYTRPVDYKKLGLNVAAGAIIVLLSYLVFKRLKVVAYSTKSWASASLVFILTMISGQMWNSIRGASYVSHGRGGTVEWFAGGFQEQYGLESQIVAAVYGVATLAIILLGSQTPKIKTPLLQSLVSIFLMLIFVGCLSFTTALFKRKFPPYPYKIFFQ